MSAPEKVAYLKGLMEGLHITKETDEGKLFTAIADVLEEISTELRDLNAGVKVLSDEIDTVSDDLIDLEDTVYGEEDDLDDDDPIYSATCPECGEVVCFDESYLEDGTIRCPSCGSRLEFDRSELMGLNDDEEDDNNAG